MTLLVGTMLAGMGFGTMTTAVLFEAWGRTHRVALVSLWVGAALVSLGYILLRIAETQP